MNVATQATVLNIGTYADGGWKIILVTGELDRNVVGDLKDLHRREVAVFLSDVGITQEQKDAIEKVELAPEAKIKTPSKRLRDVLYRLWQQIPVGADHKLNFENYYSHKMEQIIDQIKEQLD